MCQQKVSIDFSNLETAIEYEDFEYVIVGFAVKCES